MSTLNSHETSIGELPPETVSSDTLVRSLDLDILRERQARCAALAAQDAAELERFARLHPPTPAPVSGLVRAAKVARDVLAAFGAGRSAELDPRAQRETLTSKAIRAGWGR